MLKNKQAIPFVYIVTVSLTSGATGTASLTMASDSLFELHKINAWASRNTESDVEDNTFSVQIQDTSSGQLLSSARVPQAILAPRQSGGNRMARPIIFPPSALLQFDFLELSSGTNNVTLSLEGFKIFDRTIA